MKKYKLISKYPGSPKLGTILSPKIDVENTNTNNYYWEGSWFNPSNFTEFWEEVIAPDYEILEYSTNETLTSKQILTKDMEGWNEIVESTTFKIHSVKRLSDGEVFTIGDRVSRDEDIFKGTLLSINNKFEAKTTSENCIGMNWLKKVEELDYEILSYVKKGSTTCYTIKRRGGERHEEFWDIRVVKRLSDGEIFKIGGVIKTYENGRPHQIDSITLFEKRGSIKQGIWINYDGGSQHFSNTISLMHKLFTTKDGVDIYVGDQTWILHKNSWHLSPKPTKHNNVSWFQSGEPAHWSFSTKEAAEAYMLNNKPCLSLNDILEMGVPLTPGELLIKVIDLVKSKI